MKQVFTLIACLFAASALRAQTLTIQNQTPCTITYQAIADQPGGCHWSYNTGSQIISPNSSVNISSAGTLPAWNWVFVRYYDPGVVTCGSAGVPPCNGGTVDAVGAPACGQFPVNNCYTIQSNCNTCPLGQPVQFNWQNIGGGNVLLTIN